MQVVEAIHQLSADLARCTEYEVVVMTRAKDPQSGTWGATEAFDVLEVVLDEADEDVNLITNEDGPENAHAARALRVGDLLARLQSLGLRCGEWPLFSGSALAPMSAEWQVRMDAPLVGFAINHQERMYAFLQWPPEQWEAGITGE